MFGVYLYCKFNKNYLSLLFIFVTNRFFRECYLKVFICKFYYALSFHFVEHKVNWDLLYSHFAALIHMRQWVHYCRVY